MAISASSYAVGNRLYKGATSAPTRGRVDPTGYIDRELNKVASRSGIASSALRRMSGGPLASVQQNSQQQSQQYSTQSAPTQAAPTSQVGTTGQVKGVGGGPYTVGADSLLGRAAVKMSPIGKLKAPELRNPAELPFDPESADAEESLMFQKNRFDQDEVAAQQDLERQWMMGRRQVEEELPGNQRRLLENFAGRGLAYSSGYAYDQGDLQSRHAGALSELDQGKAQSFADLLRQRQQFTDEFGMNLKQVKNAAARRAAEQAAEIELDNAAKNAQYEKDLADAQAALGPNPDQVYVPSNPNQPYDNNYTSPTMNINPNNPVIAAPSVGGTGGGGIANGPGRNIRPNPIYTPPPVPGGIANSLSRKRRR